MNASTTRTARTTTLHRSRDHRTTSATIPHQPLRVEDLQPYYSSPVRLEPTFARQRTAPTPYAEVLGTAGCATGTAAAFSRPVATTEINFAEVVRRRDASRVARKAALVALVISMLTVVGYAGTGAVELVGVAGLAAALALVAAVRHTRLDRAPLPFVRA